MRTPIDERQNGTATAVDAAFEVARLTPIGRGAVACVGVRGARGWDAFLERWRRADGRAAAFGAWSREAAARPYFGLFRLEAAETSASEEIVLRRRTATAFELCGHGGDFVSSSIVRFFVERGATLVSGDAWTRAVEREETGKTIASRLDDLFFDAADELVARTTTETTAKIALDQRGAWRAVFADWRRKLDSGDPSQSRRVAAAISALEGKIGLGRRLTTPLVVLSTGIPNAGKSSLTNAALGFERVVVSSTPGTTRDLVGTTAVVAGWTFRFVDSAGLRDATDPIERAGTKLVERAAAKADVVVRLFDATVGRAEQEAAFRRFLTELGAENAATATIDALNKTDLPLESRALDWRETNGERNDGVGRETGAKPIEISAKTGAGVESLTNAILAATVGDPNETERGALPWNDDQLAFLRALRGTLERGDVDAARAAIR